MHAKCRAMGMSKMHLAKNGTTALRSPLVSLLVPSGHVLMSSHHDVHEFMSFKL